MKATNEQIRYCIDCAIKYMRMHGEEIFPLNVERLKKQIYCENKKRGINYELPSNGKSAQHYISVARLWYRNEFLEGNNSNALNDDELEVLKNTNLIFNNCADELYRLQDEYFLNVLRDCYVMIKSRIVESRAELDNYFRFRMQNIPQDAFRFQKKCRAHEELQELARRYIKQECSTVWKELIIVKRKKLDVLGWSDSGKMVGCEVKVTLKDFLAPGKIENILFYAGVCHKFYVFTYDLEVYNSMLELRRKKMRNNIGVVLCDKESEKILREALPVKENMEVDFLMLKYAKKRAAKELYKQIEDVILYVDKENNPQSIKKNVISFFETEYVK